VDTERDTADAAAATPATPATPPDAGAAAASGCGRSSRIRRGGASTGPQPRGQVRETEADGWWWYWKDCQVHRLMPIKLICLNLNRHLNLNKHWHASDTRWQQPVPAYRPASLANKKLQPKGYMYTVQRCTYMVQRTRFNGFCSFYKMYVAFCTFNIRYTNP
jgi:hypothetical protein